MLNNENEVLALSISISKLLANSNLSISELAIWASFFANLSSNLSVIIQTRNLQNFPNTDPIIEEDIL